MEHRELQIRDTASKDKRYLDGADVVYVLELLDQARSKIRQLEGALIKTPDELHVLSKKVEDMGFGKRISPPSHHTECGWKSCEGGKACHERFR